jgi:hypothetical protein
MPTQSNLQVLNAVDGHKQVCYFCDQEPAEQRVKFFPDGNLLNHTVIVQICGTCLALHRKPYAELDAGQMGAVDTDLWTMDGEPTEEP